MALCPICSIGTLQIQLILTNVEYRTRIGSVYMKYLVCDACNVEMLTQSEIDFNQQAYLSYKNDIDYEKFKEKEGSKEWVAVL